MPKIINIEFQSENFNLEYRFESQSNPEGTFINKIDIPCTEKSWFVHDEKIGNFPKRRQCIRMILEDAMKIANEMKERYNVEDIKYYAIYTYHVSEAIIKEELKKVKNKKLDYECEILQLNKGE